MKYMISEKQLSNLILKKQQMSDDLEYDHVSGADPSKDDFVIGQEVGEQDEPSISTSDSSSSSDEVSSMGADEYPAYPEVSRWDPKISRGHANPLGNTVWKSGIVRGTGNPVSPQTQ